MSGDLSFDRMEPAEGGAPPAPACGGCGAPIGAEYYEAGGKPLCPGCKDQLEAALRSSGNFAKAALFGVGGALVGAVIYFGVAALTGYEIGLIAILVGWLVGKGVRTGAGTGGGRKYQLTAVLLTYVAIAVSYGGLLVKEIATAPAAIDSVTTGAGPAASFALFVLGLPIIIGLASPPGSLIGLFIIAVGLAQSWRMNARLVVPITGPFSVNRRPAAT